MRNEQLLLSPVPETPTDYCDLAVQKTRDLNVAIFLLQSYILLFYLHLLIPKSVLHNSV